MEKGVIYKYQLNVGRATVFEVPARSQFLSVKGQNDRPVAYFLINAENVTEKENIKKHMFYTFGTGHSFAIDRNMEYVDTVMLDNENFVLHVFKV